MVLLWLIPKSGGLFNATGKAIDLSLSKNRVDVGHINDLLKSKPTILAINSSSPWVLDELDGTATKSLMATFGTTADALLDIVSGAYKPTGKLPFTIPVSQKADTDNKSDLPGYQEGNGYALFRFGDGISY